MKIQYRQKLKLTKAYVKKSSQERKSLWTRAHSVKIPSEQIAKRAKKHTDKRTSREKLTRKSSHLKSPSRHRQKVQQYFVHPYKKAFCERFSCALLSMWVFSIYVFVRVGYRLYGQLSVRAFVCVGICPVSFFCEILFCELLF